MRLPYKKSSGSWVKMNELTHSISEGSTGKDNAVLQHRVAEPDSRGNGEGSSVERDGEVGEVDEVEARSWWSRRKTKTYSHAHFRVYKRRWFGLAQLVLLNVVVSWDVRCGWLDMYAR